MKKLSSLIMGLLMCSVPAYADNFEAELKPQISQAAKRDLRLTFREGQTQKFQTQKAEYMLQLVEIQDSRCPADAVCVWQGEAETFFTLTKTDSYEIQEFSLTTLNPEQVFQLDNVEISLVDVSPYPLLSMPEREKFVTLNIRYVEKPIKNCADILKRACIMVYDPVICVNDKTTPAVVVNSSNSCFANIDIEYLLCTQRPDLQREDFVCRKAGLIE